MMIDFKMDLPLLSPSLILLFAHVTIEHDFQYQLWVNL